MSGPQPLRYPGGLLEHVHCPHSNRHFSPVNGAIFAADTILGAPGILDSTEIKHMVDLWTLIMLLEESANKESPGKDASPKPKPDGIATEASIQRGAMRYLPRLRRRHRRPAPYDLCR